MKQIEISTQKVTLLAVELPERATEIFAWRSSIKYRDGEYGSYDKFVYKIIEIPEGNWQHIGTLDQMTEEVWTGIVDLIDESDLSYGYEHYMSDSEFENADRVEALTTATESGLSLLKANGVDELDRNRTHFFIRKQD